MKILKGRRQDLHNFNNEYCDRNYDNIIKTCIT